jgi:hypothetical protein
MNKEEPGSDHPKACPPASCTSRTLPEDADRRSPDTKYVAFIEGPSDATWVTVRGGSIQVHGRHRPAQPMSKRDWLLLAAMVTTAAALVVAWSTMLGSTTTVASWATLTTAVVAVTTVMAAERAFKDTQIRSVLAGMSIWSLTGIATAFAGRRRLILRQEWAAHLARESGHDPANSRKVREALGFVVSAIRCRCSDVAEAAWTPVDAALKSRALSNLFVLVPTAVAAQIVLRHEGTLGMVKAAESISAIGGALYALVRLGRWWRDVKPPEPKARRAKE